MKYCPYCGVVLADGAAPFCADCGKELPNKNRRSESQKAASPQTHPETARKLIKTKRKKSKKHQTQNAGSFPESDHGYDGYYDDVPTEDDGHVKERLEPGLIKRIIILGAGVIIVIALAVLAMYFL